MPEKGAREHATHPVDLNTASENELAEVSDIGPQRARKIIEYRQKRGGFRSVDDLVNVEGFGGTLKDDLRNALTVSGSRKAA
jgi:competence protein ComEA